MSIKINHRGDFLKTERFLRKANTKLGSRYQDQILEKYGRKGVEALASTTPKDTGKTSQSWSYEVISAKDSVRLVWKNSNIVDGVPIAIILFYGHGTRNGGYVEGRDYINPALQPIFDEIADELWKEIVTE